MTREEVEACAMALPAATMVVLFHGKVDVYKVGGKAFATYGRGGEGLSFKVTQIGFAILTEDGGPGRPAPGFAYGHWANIDPADLPAQEVAEWLVGSHRLVSAGLTRKRRQELGLA